MNFKFNFFVGYCDVLCASGFTQHPIQYTVNPNWLSQSNCAGTISTDTVHLKDALMIFETGNDGNYFYIINITIIL